MLTRRSQVAFSLVCLSLSACSAMPSGDASPDAATPDAASDSGRPDAEAPDSTASDSAASDSGLPTAPDAAGPVCEGIERAIATAPQSCPAPALVLGSPATAVAPRARGVDTFAISSVIARSDGHRASGDVTGAPWVDGDDATVHFRAARGGRWRITARGVGAHRISATRACSANPAAQRWVRALERPSDAWIVTGPELTTEVALELFAERGERFDLVVDGCARGTACAYDVRAELVGALECAEGNGCGARARCFIDRCDVERYACVSNEALDAIRPASVRAWRERSGIFVAGTAAGWPRNLPPIERAIRYELLDSAGSVAVHALSSPTARLVDGAFAPSQLHLYPRAEVQRVRLSFSATEFSSTRSESALIDVAPAARQLALGEPCEPGYSLERCAEGLVCPRAASGARVCSPPAARIDSAVGYAQTYFDPNGVARSGPMVFIDVLGDQLQLGPWRARVLDRAGGARTGYAYCDYSEPGPPDAQTAQRYACSVAVEDAALLPDIARVVLFNERVPSAPEIEASVEPVAVGGLGARCGRMGRSPTAVGEVGRCDEGLACAGNRCVRESLPWLCAGAAVPEWAPTEASSAVTGATTASAYSRGCTHDTGLRAAMDFVARSRGSYTFSVVGSATVRYRTECAAPSCVGDGAIDPTATTLELEEGARVHFTALTTSATPTFTLRVDRR
jgi:hypothetical protein